MAKLGKVALDMLRGAGVELMLHTKMLGVTTKPAGARTAVESVIVQAQGERGVILAKQLVDCSGDAYLVHYAGGKTKRTPRASVRNGFAT